MKNNASLFYALILVVGDFLALVAAFSVAYILRVKLDPRPLIEQIPAETFFYTALTVVPLWIVVNAFLGLYNSDIYERRPAELGHLVVGSVLGILTVIGYDFVVREDIFPARLVPVYGFVLGFSFLVLFRTIARILRHTLFRYGFGVSNILIIGDTAASANMADAIKNTRKTGQNLLGVVGKKIDDFNHYKSFNDALKRLRRPIHGIIQTELYKSQDRNNEILMYAQQNHVSYRFVPGNTDLFVGNIDVELFAGLPVVNVNQTALTGWGRIVKRLFDLSVSIMLLIILSPIMLIVALGVKLSDPRGPVFLRQVRLTRYNTEFKLFKFRSHYYKLSGLPDKEAFELLGKPELYEEYMRNGNVLERDPRVTPFGRFIRKISLDELAQLFNVVKGDLSLVGPRALVPEELNAYEKKHAILSVKSGITGLAQVSGRREISFDERRKLDVYYVQNWTFWGDIVILLKTVRVIINND